MFPTFAPFDELKYLKFNQLASGLLSGARCNIHVLDDDSSLSCAEISSRMPLRSPMKLLFPSFGMSALLESILPADGKLKALFLTQLKPDGLSANVSFNEPNSLAEAMKMAVTEAMSLADMFRKTQAQRTLMQ